jgi:hypothetical protein
MQTRSIAMNTTTARLDRSVLQLTAAVLLIAVAGTFAAGSALAANEPSDTAQAQPVSVQQSVKTPSKSSIKRQEIQQKLARHEPLTYTETLYLR